MFCHVKDLIKSQAEPKSEENKDKEKEKDGVSDMTVKYFSIRQVNLG